MKSYKEFTEEIINENNSVKLNALKLFHALTETDSSELQKLTEDAEKVLRQKYGSQKITVKDIFLCENKYLIFSTHESYEVFSYYTNLTKVKDEFVNRVKLGKDIDMVWLDRDDERVDEFFNHIGL